MKLGFAKNFLKSEKLQTNFEHVLEICRMNKFNEFRTTVLSCVRKGVTQEQYKTLKDGKPEFEAIMDKCSKYGILKTGRITK